MGCSNCGGSEGASGGCGNKGNCSSGGCSKHDTYDWISAMELHDPSEYNIVEVSFKNGARKDFFMKSPEADCVTGEMVVVEAASGYDVGKITLSGELVRLQMRKKHISEERVVHKVLRKAGDRDLEKLEEARSIEHNTMVRARVIARTLGLDMKIGDVEYQGDKKKATFYYTADGRVDFRELVKEYAREFKIKIEMRQIGARQEAARLGGISSSGRELCCSTWLSDFKSVSTSAARYQNIAINQSKLTGPCGRLKCCLNYELDTYLDALEDFPEDADVLKTKIGTLVLMKTDIFKRRLYYAYENNDKLRGTVISLSTARAKEVKELNNKGIIPDEILSDEMNVPVSSDMDDENIEHEYEDVTGLIELRNEPKKKKKRKNKVNNPAASTQASNLSKSLQNSNKESGQQGNQTREEGQKKQDKARKENQPPSAQQQQPQNTRPKNEHKEIKASDKPENASGQSKQGKKKKFYNKNRKPKGGQESK